MEKTIPKHLMFPSALLLVVIHTLQTGVGITGFARFVFKHANQDSWIAVILAGGVAHLLILIIIQTLKRFNNMDLFDIHVHLFGKWIGNGLNILYMGYLFSYAITYIINYYAFASEYLMPDYPIWLIAAMMLILAIYAVRGGIRIVLGVCLISFLFTDWLFLVLAQTLTYFEPQHFLPILEASPKQLAMGTYQMSFSLTGFELLYFLYPYASEKKTVHRYSQWSIFLTNVLYLWTMILTVGFYSKTGLIKTIWPTLNLYKAVSFPFLEQFEMIVISFMILILLPNMSVLLWVVSKGVKKVTSVKQTIALYVLCGCILVISLLFKTYSRISKYTDFFNLVSLYASFIYPIVLFALSWLIQIIRKKRQKQ